MTQQTPSNPPEALPDAKKKKPTKTAFLTTRCYPDIKAIFKRRAKGRGMTEGELLDLLIADLLSKSEPVTPLLPTTKDLQSKQRTVRMPQFLWAEVKRRAEGQGMTSNRWLTSLVQSNLMRLPVLTDQEVFVIRERNRELAAIGRNLNQIARALNDSIVDPGKLKIEMLAVAIESIDSGQAVIQDLVAAAYRNWESRE